MTMSCSRTCALSMPLVATATGSPTPLPGSGAYTVHAGLLADDLQLRAPRSGRCRSEATSSGVWPWPFSQSASLPASVVLPAPCRPASMITVGGFLA